MRAAAVLALLFVCGGARAAEAPFLSKGWTFDEPDGASIYAHVCAACHQSDGRGAEGAGGYPALAGDEKLDSTDYVLNVLLGGYAAMPALGRAMTDEQVADLVNYVRTRFGGASEDPATPERAAAARAALKR